MYSITVVRDYCEDNPCENGGTCSDYGIYIKGYSCRCTKDFYGKNCSEGMINSQNKLVISIMIIN